MEVYKGHLNTAGDLKLKQITKKNIYMTWVTHFSIQKVGFMSWRPKLCKNKQIHIKLWALNL